MKFMVRSRPSHFVSEIDEFRNNLTVMPDLQIYGPRINT